MSKNIAGTNTGKQGGAPALPNNFSGALSSQAKENAPKIGSTDFTPSPNQHERGKDGTQG
jgi:hypothetical protein